MINIQKSIIFLCFHNEQSENAIKVHFYLQELQREQNT